MEAIDKAIEWMARAISEGSYVTGEAYGVVKALVDETMKENGRQQELIYHLRGEITKAQEIARCHHELNEQNKHKASQLLETVKLAYRKHHMDDPTIGWDELDNKLLDALCNAMGDGNFNKWLESV